MLVKEKRLEFQKTLEEYIEEQKLYELFESMMKGLIIDQPANPIEYLEKKLQAQESK
jgi:adenylate kinase